MKSPGGPLLPLSPKAALTHSQEKKKKYFQAFSGMPEGKTNLLSYIHMLLPKSYTHTHRFGLVCRETSFPIFLLGIVFLFLFPSKNCQVAQPNSFSLPEVSYPQLSPWSVEQ